jgi:hypothetical protein
LAFPLLQSLLTDRDTVKQMKIEMTSTAGVGALNKTAVLLTLIFVLVVFPLLNSGAFADLIGNGTLPMNLLSEPLNLLIFGAGLMVFGSSLRRI